MPSRPWLKFYPADWQADQALGMCSLAARGLWMEMLAIMHRAEPYGHLLVNGMKPSDEQLAALARASVGEVSALLIDLERTGVFSRTRNSTIYSRRMTKDEKKRKDGVQAAESGELPGSRRARQGIEKSQTTAPPPGVVGTVERDHPPPQRPEARGQRPDQSSLLDGDGFRAWYDAYPLHVGRAKAEIAYRKALDRASADALLKAAEAAARVYAGRDRRFIPHPATWLNSDRWADDEIREAAGHPTRQRPPASDAELRAWCWEYADTQTWPGVGAAPDEPGADSRALAIWRQVHDAWQRGDRSQKPTHPDGGDA